MERWAATFVWPVPHQGANLLAVQFKQYFLTAIIGVFAAFNLPGCAAEKKVEPLVDQRVELPKREPKRSPAPQTAQVVANWIGIEPYGSGVTGLFKVVVVTSYGAGTPILPGGTLIKAIFSYRLTEEELIQLRSKNPQGDWQVSLSYQIIPDGATKLFNWRVTSLTTDVPNIKESEQ
ncbi:MAG: hypothetical protein IID13_09380 [Candidatus Marinimicrobia bacterium]|nr:hypothetical protein [Candidatus Neomarinimicrobiota bacterium]